jgi:hypothetical protein
MESKDQERFKMDGLLEAALKQYGAAEPRPGLEGRILANLRAAERDRPRPRVWLWLPLLIGAAAILLVGMAVVLRTHTANLPLATGNRPAVPVPQAETEAPKRADLVPVPHRRHRKENVASSVPRLEQFPSPQPLSEQEEILARYIEHFPREAMLVAQAQTELLKQEMRGQEIPPENRLTQDSQEQN